MVRRHPHVFGDVTVKDSEEVIVNWEKIKAAEKKTGEDKASLLDQVGKGLPALLRAYDYQKQASKVGFDWNQVEEAWKKVKEEMQEFEMEMAKGNKREQLDELGDLLFAVVNVARLSGIHPEEALQMTNEKFYRRFASWKRKSLKVGYI